MGGGEFMLKVKTKSIPSPQVILPGEWTIKEDRKAEVDIANKEYTAPFDFSEESSYTRAHEYAHIKWSTEETPFELSQRWEVKESSINICEDARMAQRLDKREIHIPDSMLRRLDLSSEYDAAAHIIMCAPKWEQVCDMYEVDESFKSRVKFIIDALDDLETASKRFDDLFLKKDKKTIEASLPAGSPGEMSILTPTLQRKFNTFIKKNYSEGFIFTSPQRVLTDKLCFKRKVKKKFKGTVLIDVSGSMGWNKKRLLTLVEKIPAATIACYSGEGAYGKLYIVAKNGYVVNKLPKFGSMNVIDVPAIEWLSQQPAPRIWLGDGGIAGVYDGPLTYRWTEYFSSIITAGDIIRYNHEQEFLGDFK